MSGIVQFWCRGAVAAALANFFLTLRMFAPAIRGFEYSLYYLSLLPEFLFKAFFIGLLVGAVNGTLQYFLSIRLARSLSLPCRLLIGTILVQALLVSLYLAAALNSDFSLAVVQNFADTHVAALCIGGFSSLMLPARAEQNPIVSLWPGRGVR